jgi:electron transfer flavoprotein alpha subunit
MKDSEMIIAVNTDANAPIFDVAHYGSTCDLFDVAEAMLEKLE